MEGYFCVLFVCSCFSFSHKEANGCSEESKKQKITAAKNWTNQQIKKLWKKTVYSVPLQICVPGAIWSAYISSLQAGSSYSPAMATEDSVDVFSCLSIILQDAEFPDPALRMMELLTVAVLVSAERGVPVMLSPLLFVHNSWASENNLSDKHLSRMPPSS